MCVTRFIKLWTQFGRNVSPQPWTWEQQLQYRTLYNVLQAQQQGIKAGATVCGTYCFPLSVYITSAYRHSPLYHLPTGTLTKKQLRHILFEEAVDTILAADQAENQISSRCRALLQASSCFGNHQASLLLATMHLSGLRHEVDQEQVEPASFQDGFPHICVMSVCTVCV